MSRKKTAFSGKNLIVFILYISNFFHRIENFLILYKQLNKLTFLNLHFNYTSHFNSANIESGAMGHLSHDKGERAGLGRLVEVVSFNNRKCVSLIPVGTTA